MHLHTPIHTYHFTLPDLFIFFLFAHKKMHKCTRASYTHTPACSSSFLTCTLPYFPNPWGFTPTTPQGRFHTEWNAVLPTCVPCNQFMPPGYLSWLLLLNKLPQRAEFSLFDSALIICKGNVSQKKKLLHCSVWLCVYFMNALRNEYTVSFSTFNLHSERDH